MNDIPTARVVFDRKHVATQEKRGLVQIQITYKRKRRWVSTGVKVLKGQWRDGRVVKRTDAAELNEWIGRSVAEIEKWLRENRPFTWEKLEWHLKETGPQDNFIDWVEKTIRERNDIRETTRRTQMKLVRMLDEWGGIKYFSDLTAANIKAFDNWLHGRRLRKIDADGREVMAPMRLPSIYEHHKLMRTYVHLAIAVGKLRDDPYVGLRFQKGESEPGRYLTVAELKALREAPMRSGSVARARDMFVFQAYTGLAYSDLAAFDFSQAKEDGGQTVYGGKRVKTGEEFFFVILPPAMEILKKYGYKLPVVAGQSYNSLLKKAAADAGIKKPISSHWARRTAGMMLLNAGVRIETVARVLGHASVKTTEHFYAEITKRTVVEEMGRLSGNL